MARQVDGVEFSVIVDSSGAVDSSNRVVASNEEVERSFRQVDKASVRTGNVTEKSGKKASAALSGFSRQAGQAGIQVQQLVGQIQGGQSVFGALSAQAADLGIVLGAPLVGAVAGLSAAFAGVLLPSLFNSKNAIEQLEEVTGKLKDTFDKADDGTVKLGEGIAELAKRSEALARIKIASSIKDAEEQIKASSSGIAEAIQDMAKVSLKNFNDAVLSSGLSFKQLTDDAFDTSEVVDSIGVGGVKQLNALRDAVSSLSRRFDISREQAVSLASAISDFQNNPGPVGIKRLQSALEDLNAETGNSNEKLVNFASAMIPFFTAAQEGVDVTNLFRQALADLGVALDKTKPPTKELKEYAGNVQALAQSLAIAEAKLAGNAEEAFRLQAAFQFGVSTFEQLPESAKALVDRLKDVGDQQRANNEADLAAEQAKRKAEIETARQRSELESQFSKISGVNKDSGQTDLQALQEKFKSERDIINEHLKLKLQDQSLSQQQQQVLAQDHANQIVAINQRQMQAQQKLAEMEKQSKISALSQTFSNLSSLMNTESKKLFEIGKAGAVAGAIVDGYAAVSKTMASVPYPFNIPLAAAQAVASAAQVQGILKTKFGDKNANQVYSGGLPATPVTQQQGGGQPDRNISIALTGSSFTGSDIRALIGQINDELGDGVSLGVTGG